MDMNMYEAIKGVCLLILLGRRHYLPEGRVKFFMFQLLKALDHMHSIGIFHRDIKPYLALVQMLQGKHPACGRQH